MKLPHIVTSEYEVTLPLLKKMIKIRPFLVKEEKILLMAMEGGNPDEIANSIKQVIQNCILSLGIDVEELSTTDVEFLFLQIRKRSMGEILDIGLKHRNNPECTEINKVKINIDDIKIHIPEGHDNKILLTDKVGLVMRYPNFRMTKQISEEKKTESIFNLIAASIEQVFDEHKVMKASDFSKEDLMDWIETFTQEQFEKVFGFFNTTPYLRYEVKFKCEKCEEVEEFELRGLLDFFT